jgi:hypothetical protein
MQAMKTRHLLTVAFCGLLIVAAAAAEKDAKPAAKDKATSSPASSQAAKIAIDRSTYRIGYSADGNQHDLDDIAASPMAIAMAAAAGLTDRLVHFDYANHLGDNNDSQEKAMVESVQGAARHFGVPMKVLFNDQKQLDEAVASIARQINASTEADRFYLIAAGPMEVVWRGVNASDKDRRRFCTVISHSTWNEKHADTPQMKHTWDDVKKLGVETIDIVDQNRAFNAPPEEWSWMKDSSRQDWQFLFSRNRKKQFDVSDSGMMWFVITGRGDQHVAPSKVKELFTSSAASQPASAPAK